MLRFAALASVILVAATAERASSSNLRATSTGGLNDAAHTSGRYMGTATDLNPSDTYYTQQLKNAHDFGIITPANAMKVRRNDELCGCLLL